MKPHETGFANRAGKFLAPSLSVIVAHPWIAGLSRLLESYWCVLQGKGSGTSWAMDAEIAAVRALIRRPEPPPLIFDVGANNGEWSLLIRNCFPNARILMFEPQPSCHEEIRVKSIPDAELLPFAVSSESAERQLYVVEKTAGMTSGITSLHERHDSYFQKNRFSTITVKTVRLDDVIAEREIERIDFLKMDIEGHELYALLGAAKSLRDGRIRALSFEFGSGNINSRTFFRDFWELLHPLGFRIYRILPSSRLMPINEYYEDLEYFRGVSNYVAAL